MLKRKVYEKLKSWKETSRGKTAVLVEGARRTGKSTTVEYFAQREYDDYLLLDFAKEPAEVLENFGNIAEMDVFFRNLFLIKGRRLPERKSVIIFDEVQLFPRARQAIKYLVQDGRYDYMETGSLISIKKNVKDILIPSEEEKIYMYPLDFEEFLWGVGDSVTADVIRDAFTTGKPLQEIAHRRIMQTFRNYIAVGGMPQAVAAFADGATFQETDHIKQTILGLYEDDIRKYDEDTAEKTSVVFASLPEQLANHNSHFKFSKIEKNARYARYAGAVHFIAESMIGNACYGVTKPEVALGLYADQGDFKLYMGDTGLLVSQIIRAEEDEADKLYKSLIFGRLGLNEGMIIENCVAQMLRANGHELYFHEFYYQERDEKEKKYEVDFLLVKKKKICPVEVKSSSYRRHKSFDNFKKKYGVKMQDRYVIYTKNMDVEGDIVYLPVYMTMCL